MRVGRILLILAITQMPSIDSKFSTGQKDFGFALFRQIAQSETKKNVFVSPSSVAVALAMTYNGARAETKTVMQRTLKFGDMTMDEVNKGANAWLTATQAPASNVQISIANSIWVRNGVPLQPQFVKQMESNYHGKVTDLDFSKPDAARIINNWVSAETKNKIDQIVASPIAGDKVLFLINALYFKGQWTKPFDPKQTRNAPFTLLNGTTLNVPTMSRTGDYETKNGDGYQTVRLAYGDGRLSMYVFVPSAGQSVRDLARHLTPDTWRSMTSDLSRRHAPLLMPKFTFKYDITLNETLKALGMAEAFDARTADLGDMVNSEWLRGNRLYISDVKHKTFVEVNEEGTEAAASTSGGISVTSLPVPIAVDRPFLFAIHDGATNSVLFLGIVLDPREH